MKKLRQTPSQTIGPFFAYSLTAEQYEYDFDSIIDNHIVNKDSDGEHITIKGKIFDGNGAEIHDAMIEFRQVDNDGYYQKINLDGFRGIGRYGTGTEKDRSYIFHTIKPGTINEEAPHIDIIMFMRGSLHSLYSRLYFSDENDANENDPVLIKIPETRRHTLIAKRKKTANKVMYEFDIFMQGENETVFFKI